MPILQVRSLPDDLYSQLSYLAHKDQRSLSQEAIALIREGIESRIGNKERRRDVLRKIEELNIDSSGLPDPVVLIREDRER